MNNLSTKINSFNSIYRNLIRSIKFLPKRRGKNNNNLLNLYRNQFKLTELNNNSNSNLSLKKLNLKVNKTITLLSSSPNLIKSLTHLYHQYDPSPPFTSARKIPSNQQIVWKPFQPEEAMKSWTSLNLKRSKDETYKIGLEVELTLKKTLEEAEREQGIFLGRIGEKRK